MALTDENGGTGMVMPVAPIGNAGYGGFGYPMPYPIYGGNSGNDNGGWGGDWGWIILLLLLAGNGWGNGFGGGMFGGGGLGYDFPWILNGQNGINNNVSDGFRTAQLNDNVTSIRDGISALSTQLCGCCGDIQTSLCNGFNGVTAAVTGSQNALAQQMYTNTIADLERSYAAQTASAQGMNAIQSQLANCCCENRAGIADLKYTIASEECATRANSTQNTQSILNLVNSGIQSIKDQLCQDKIDAKNDTIAQLRQELLYSRGQASQVAQNADIINGVYNRLSECPVGTVPVFGEQPIFRCNNGGCGCGCGNNGF